MSMLKHHRQCVFLLSPTASYICGATLKLDAAPEGENLDAMKDLVNPQSNF